MLLRFPTGIVGDLLVVEGDVSLRVLMWISAVSVCIGFLVGVVVIQPPHVHTVSSDDSDGKRGDDTACDGTVNPINTATNKDVTVADTTDGTPPSSPTPLTSPPVHTTTTTTHTTITPAATPLTFADKLRLFREQLVFLRMAFQSRTLTALVLYWVVGNAVFSVSACSLFVVCAALCSFLYRLLFCVWRVTYHGTTYVADAVL